MDTLQQKAGIRIRTYRENKEFSQEELAHRALMNQSYLGKIERGEKNITISTLNKILVALGISFAEFFEFEQEAPLPPEPVIDKTTIIMRNMTLKQQVAVYNAITALYSLNDERE